MNQHDLNIKIARLIVRLHKHLMQDHSNNHFSMDNFYIISQNFFCTKSSTHKKKLHNLLQAVLPLTCANSRAVAAIVVSLIWKGNSIKCLIELQPN